MSPSWFIAKRYIQAHRRNGFLSFITTIAILGVMLGTAALILTLSVLDGFEHEIKTKVINFTSHIEVQGFQNQSLENYRQSIEKVKHNVPGVLAISPFAAREGMIRSRDGIDGIFLKGVDLQSDILQSRQHIVEGAFLSASAAGSHQIIIGRKLANRLNVGVGDKLVVFALPRQAVPEPAQPKAMQFQLVGIYESGMAEFDDIFAYTDLSSAQSLFQIDDNVSGFDVLVSDINSVDRVAAQIQDLLGYPHYARTVFQLYRNLFSWVELQKKLSPILLSLIIVVATVNIIGTLLMFVLEKMHAIGILKSLGAGPKLIRRIFTLQGVAIALVGIILGNLLGYVLASIQLKFHVITIPSDIYYMSAAPILLRWQNFAIVTVVAFVLCLLTALLPSRAAAKVDAIKALRFG